MNQRILELADQAARAAAVLALPTGNTGDELFVDKFAELILTEVISTIYRSDISDKKQEKLVDELAYKFGMK